MGEVRIALVWENFGPSHLDRIAACASAGMTVTAIELNSTSETYQWEAGDVAGVERVTLDQGGGGLSSLALTWKLFRAVRRSNCDAVFLCHYQIAPVFLAALLLRLSGTRVFTMLDSKFDDYPRFLWRELGKKILLSPYQGALVGSQRSADYLHFLGFQRRPVLLGFDALDLARIRALAGNSPRKAHAKRDFLIVARLVEKKNLAFAIEAFAEWRRAAAAPRNLRIIGYGNLEASLRALAVDRGVANAVLFEGIADSAAVYRAMRDALCLILPSTEEQFGLVVIEALALGLPVLVSSNAGAVDGLIDNGVNGWVIDPRRGEALGAGMALLDRSEPIWQAASAAAQATSERGDVSHFVTGVKALLSPGKAVAAP
jgi:glycosyltransferase involved in cell wall biosynthesis